MLSQIMHSYGSDKDVNGYTQLYSILFNGMREKPISLLEIGIGTMIPGAPSSMVGYSQPGYKPGGSLRGWRDYFSHPESKIMGADIQKDTQFTDEPRITTVLCNSTNPQEVNKVFGDGVFDPRVEFDIIIDDGSHYDMHQMATLQAFWPHLKEGGIYVIEDIYPSSQISGFPQLVEGIVGKDIPFFYSGIKNNLCVIKKMKLVSNRNLNF